MLNRDFEIVTCSSFVKSALWSCDMNSTLGYVVPLAMLLIMYPVGQDWSGIFQPTIIGWVFWNVHRQMTEYFGFDNFWSTRHSASSKFECKNLVCFIKLYKKNKLKERRLFISISWARVDCVFLSLLLLSCLVGPNSQMLIFLSSILTNTCLCFSIFYPLGMFLSWLCLLYLSWLSFLYFPDFGLKLKYFEISSGSLPFSPHLLLSSYLHVS